MFEDFSKRNKAVRAALELAAEARLERRDVSPPLPTAPGSASPIFAATSPARRTCSGRFKAEVDAEVLAKAKPAGASEQSPRDRVFDMIMTRFEVMAPYKPALRRISHDLCCHPAEAAQLLPSSLASQYWMLAGAGAKLDGPGAGLRVAGLAVDLRQSVSRLARR